MTGCRPSATSFAIATAIEPDILLLDEVLGAGDAQFMIKAQQRIEQLMQRASLLVLASHSTDTIRQFCNKALLLRAGRIEEIGPVDSVIAAYERYVALLRWMQPYMQQPAGVAAVVGRAMTAFLPRARYLVGYDAQLLLLAERFVPTVVRDRITRFVLGL